MILLHCEALIGRGARRIWLKPSSTECTLCSCQVSHVCETIPASLTHFRADPNHSRRRGAQCLSSPWGYSRSPSGSSGMLSLPHSVLVTLAVSPRQGAQPEAAAQPHFTSGGVHPPHSHQIPRDQTLGQACYSLMDRNDASNDSPSVNSTSAAMQRSDFLLLVNSQQIPVCSFSLVQRIPKPERNQINVISNSSCG